NRPADHWRKPFCKASSALRVLFEELDGIADCQNRLGGIIGYFATELFFKRHDQLDGIEAVGTKVVNEAGVLRHLVGFHTQMFHDDFLYPLANVTHRLDLVRFSISLDRSPQSQSSSLSQSVSCDGRVVIDPRDEPHVI